MASKEFPNDLSFNKKGPTGMFMEILRNKKCHKTASQHFLSLYLRTVYKSFFSTVYNIFLLSHTCNTRMFSHIIKSILHLYCSYSYLIFRLQIYQFLSNLFFLSCFSVKQRNQSLNKTSVLFPTTYLYNYNASLIALTKFHDLHFHHKLKTNFITNHDLIYI